MGPSPKHFRVGFQRWNGHPVFASLHPMSEAFLSSSSLLSTLCSLSASSRNTAIARTVRGVFPIRAPHWVFLQLLLVSFGNQIKVMQDAFLAWLHPQDN